MKRTPSAVDHPRGIEPLTRELFDAPDAPSPAAPGPGSVACPAPRDGAAQRYRMPLWRPFDKRRA